MAFMLGENIGPYRLVEQLGRGGMATVYKAYHARLDRYVAIKALHPAFMEDPNFLARFQREARVVARLEHPNIVPIYDFAEHSERPYLVLKYVEGETLKARLLRKDISDKEIKDIFESVASALAYAHEQGILHRDVKPSNVLITEDGQIYLADFGLARIAQTGESTLSTDMMLGTPQYISPEQAKGVSDLDQGTDIYSLGVMMYEMLVGRVPFSADTPFSVIHDHIYSPLPLPREVNPNISPTIERILLKALAKDREDRYENVSLMREAFQDVWEEEVDGLPNEADEQATLPPTPAIRDAMAAKPVGEASPAVIADPTDVDSPTVEESAPSALPTPAESPSTVPSSTTIKVKRKRSIPHWVWWMILPIFILLCLGAIVLKNATDAPGPGEILENIEAGSRDISEVQADLDNDPNNPYLHMELAAIYWENEQVQMANEEVVNVFGFAEDEPVLYLDFGNLLAEHGAWVYAAPSYILAERNMSNPPGEINDYISQAVYLGAFDPQAMNILLNPDLELDSMWAELVKARSALMENDFTQAENILDFVLSQNPDMPDALLFEVDLLIAQGKTREALRMVQILESRDDLPGWVYFELEQIRQEISHRGDALAENGDGQWENSDARQAVNKNPNDPIAHVNLAIAYWDEGKTQEAKNTAYHAFDLTEGDSVLYKEIGDIFAERQVWLFAAQAYLLSNKNAKANDGNLYDLISEAVYFAAFEDEALELLGDPRLGFDSLVLDLVEVRHYMEKGELDKAEDLLMSVLEQKPDMLVAHLLEADLLRARGEFEAAHEVLLEMQRSGDIPDWIKIQIQELWRKIDEEK